VSLKLSILVHAEYFDHKNNKVSKFKIKKNMYLSYCMQTQLTWDHYRLQPLAHSH